MNKSGGLLLSVVAALLAAIIGGAIWALIAVLTEYELGLIAWGIGGLVGFAVTIFSRPAITVVHQVIAVILSLVGILLGKYFIVGYFMSESISGIFGSDTMSIFIENFGEFFGGMDIVFVLFAVITAWRLPQSLANR